MPHHQTNFWTHTHTTVFSDEISSLPVNKLVVSVLLPLFFFFLSSNIIIIAVTFGCCYFPSHLNAQSLSDNSLPGASKYVWCSTGSNSVSVWTEAWPASGAVPEPSGTF